MKEIRTKIQLMKIIEQNSLQGNNNEIKFSINNYNSKNKVS